MRMSDGSGLFSRESTIHELEGLPIVCLIDIPKACKLLIRVVVQTFPDS